MNDSDCNQTRRSEESDNNPAARPAHHTTLRSGAYEDVDGCAWTPQKRQHKPPPNAALGVPDVINAFESKPTQMDVPRTITRMRLAIIDRLMRLE
jgi:hypothetical protein